MSLSQHFTTVVSHEWLWYALPVFVVALAAEYVLFLRHRTSYFTVSDSIASMAVGVVALLLLVVTKSLWLGLFYSIYEYRIFELGSQWWVWCLLFLGDDFTYYWFHRLGHQVNILWAGHSTHHSARHYHFATALRQAWLEYFYKYAYWMWLPLLGFDPLMVFTMLSLSQIYGFFLHTEAVGKLGPLEAVFSTPSHHRAHHGMEKQYVDRNYGGFLIVWDRLFGTFQAETERPTYGVTGDGIDDRVVSVGLRGYLNVYKRFKGASTTRARILALFGAP